MYVNYASWPSSEEETSDPSFLAAPLTQPLWLSLSDSEAGSLSELDTISSSTGLCLLRDELMPAYVLWASRISRDPL